VTSSTPGLWFRAARQVLRMIEFDIEWFLKFLRERFHWRGHATNAGVTNCAHGNVRRGELGKMATGAIFVTRESRLRGIVIAPMATGTGNRRMPLTCVQEF